jgi:hypothetical protein
MPVIDQDKVVSETVVLFKLNAGRASGHGEHDASTTPAHGRPGTVPVARDGGPMHEDRRATSVALDDAVTGVLIIQTCSWVVVGRVWGPLLRTSAGLGEERKEKDEEYDVVVAKHPSHRGGTPLGASSVLGIGFRARSRRARNVPAVSRGSHVIETRGRVEDGLGVERCRGRVGRGSGTRARATCANKWSWISRTG